MPTTKTMKKATSSAPKAPKPSAARKTTARRQATAAKSVTRFVLPSAAVLGSGALAAAGFLLREELAELMHVAIERVTLTSRQGVPKLLSFAGLQRKRSFLSYAMPELGGLAIGLLSGAALTLWLAPKRTSPVEPPRPVVLRSDSPAAHAPVPPSNSHIPS